MAAAAVPSEVDYPMGILNEFTTVYHSDGVAPASRWIARNVVLSFFHSSAYALVSASSPFVLDRTDLEQRFQENGSLERYDRRRVVEIDLPEGESHADEIVDRTGRAEIRQPFVGELRDARLIGAYPIPLDRTNRVVLEAVVSPEVLALDVGYSAMDVLGDPRPKSSGTTTPDVIDSAVLLYNRWNRGYYHWTTETLTRLEGVEAYRERTGNAPKLIVGPDPNRFQLQSLYLLGYDDDDLIRWDRRNARVERLIVPSVRRELNPGETSPVAHWWLRERMREAVSERAPAAAADESRLVYISREDAPRRQVLNEAEVVDVLAEYGFEKYVLSERSVAENVSLFARADVIVAPHGAGLTDVIYADDATVIELFRSNLIQPVYFVLSKQLGLQYRYQRCDHEGPNMVVDVGELRSLVEDVLARRQLA